MATDTLLTVPISAMRYDVVLPLLDGRVTVEGVRLQTAKTTSMVTRDVPELRSGDFGLWDLNVGYLLPAIEAGWDLVALPVFPKRKSVLQFIFCNRKSGIRSPRDLAGKRIGTRQYRTAVSLLVRGILSEHYNVDVDSMRWVAQTPDVFPTHGKPGPEMVPEKPSIAERLMAGEVDAMVTDVSDAKLLRQLESHPDIVRLFPDYAAADRAIWQESGLYPPMHVLVMGGRLNRENPDLAGKLYDALVRAKTIADDDIANDRAGFSVLYLRETFERQRKDWGDPMAYGIAANRRMIDALIDYNVREGATRERLAVESIFAAGTLNT
ncbi:MAG TPA: hypothetical protein VL966_15395 [Alphaproteobacteria bacterium]|nr:hypothetical protein [Alphaproteobacteria bacterium]